MSKLTSVHQPLKIRVQQLITGTVCKRTCPFTGVINLEGCASSCWSNVFCSQTTRKYSEMLYGNLRIPGTWLFKDLNSAIQSWRTDYMKLIMQYNRGFWMCDRRARGCQPTRRFFQKIENKFAAIGNGLRNWNTEFKIIAISGTVVVLLTRNSVRYSLCSYSYFHERLWSRSTYWFIRTAPYIYLLLYGRRLKTWDQTNQEFGATNWYVMITILRNWLRKITAKAQGENPWFYF